MPPILQGIKTNRQAETSVHRTRLRKPGSLLDHDCSTLDIWENLPETGGPTPRTAKAAISAINASNSAYSTKLAPLSRLMRINLPKKS